MEKIIKFLRKETSTINRERLIILKLIKIIRVRMKKKHHDNDYYVKKGKRSSSPVASKEELSLKKIELIIYAGNLPMSWNEDDIRKFF